MSDAGRQIGTERQCTFMLVLEVRAPHRVLSAGTRQTDDPMREPRRHVSVSASLCPRGQIEMGGMRGESPDDASDAYAGFRGRNVTRKPADQIQRRGRVAPRLHQWKVWPGMPCFVTPLATRLWFVSSISQVIQSPATLRSLCIRHELIT